MDLSGLQMAPPKVPVQQEKKALMATARTVQSFRCLGRLECCLPPSFKEKGAAGTKWFSPAFRALYWKEFTVFAAFQQHFSKLIEEQARAERSAMESIHGLHRPDLRRPQASVCYSHPCAGCLGRWELHEQHA